MKDCVLSAQQRKSRQGQEGLHPLQQPTSKDKPTILVFKFSPLNRDPRVLKQIRALKDLGRVVTCGYGEAPELADEHIRIPDSLGTWRTGPGRIPVTAFMLGTRQLKRFYWNSKRVQFVLDNVQSGSMDVVVANDAAALPLAVKLAPLRGIHADLHEYAPKQGEHSRVWRVLFQPLMNWMCAPLVQVDSTSTVAEGIAAEYARQFGISRPFVVPNATGYQASYRPTETSSPLRLIHIGAAGRGRRIEDSIKAVAAANKVRPGHAVLDIYLAPGEPSYIKELSSLAVSVGEGAVRVLDPVKYDEIIPTMHTYDVGVFVCPPSTFNLDHALPNKFFEYMQARLALLIGPSKEMAPIVEKESNGVVATGFGVSEITDALLSLDAAKVDSFKKASDAVAKKYSAEKYLDRWVDAVERLLARV